MKKARNIEKPLEQEPQSGNMLKKQRNKSQLPVKTPATDSTLNTAKQTSGLNQIKKEQDID